MDNLEMNEMMQKIKEKIIKNFKPFMKETIETVVFVVVMVIIIRFFVGEIRWIPSGSMRPTLVEGDRIFVERFSRFYSTPNRGDVMVFYPPSQELATTPMALFKRLTGFFCDDIAYIKRVVGMPGDEIEIKRDNDGKTTMLVNGMALDEEYILDDYDYVQCSKNMYCGPMKVPAKHYFMMGDNRGNSQDSRFWGFLAQDRLIGKAVFLFWPLTRLDKL